MILSDIVGKLFLDLGYSNGTFAIFFSDPEPMGSNMQTKLVSGEIIIKSEHKNLKLCQYQLIVDAKETEFQAWFELADGSRFTLDLQKRSKLTFENAVNRKFFGTATCLLEGNRIISAKRRSNPEWMQFKFDTKYILNLKNPIELKPDSLTFEGLIGLSVHKVFISTDPSLVLCLGEGRHLSKKLEVKDDWTTPYIEEGQYSLRKYSGKLISENQPRPQDLVWAEQFPAQC